LLAVTASAENLLDVNNDILVQLQCGVEQYMSTKVVYFVISLMFFLSALCSRPHGGGVLCYKCLWFTGWRYAF